MATRKVRYISYALLLLATLLLAACRGTAESAEGQPLSSKTACPISLPQDQQSIISATTFLHGNEQGLRAFLPVDGVWSDLPYDQGVFVQKMFWKYPGYNIEEDPTPAFRIVAEQLDGEGRFEQDRPATNAFADDLLGSAILTGLGIPSSGCWQFTGYYRDSQLTFVIRLEE